MPTMQPEPRATSSLPANLRPLPAEEFGFDQARHLLWRAGFGGTPDQTQTLAGWGPEKAVDHLIGYSTIAFADTEENRFDADIMRPRSEAERRAYRAALQSRDENAVGRFREEQQARQREDRRQVQSVRRWWLERMIETPRPLEEKMTLFWHGHFATSYRGTEDSYHMYRQNELFRRFAVGSFASLLRGVIRDPAMLKYLNNNASTKRKPNENLARELMELFSLGEGEYTERDIKEGARALTGYTFDDNAFVFRKNTHDTGDKRILGLNGPLDGDGFVDAILSRPACARFIASKLYRYFCRDVPVREAGQDATTRKVVGEMAGLLRRHDYEVGPALRRLFLSRHFHHETVRLEQIKSPAVLVVGAVRSLGTPARSLDTLGAGMGLMGQSLLVPPSVKGWDGGRSWINTSTIFVRQNVLAYLITGRQTSGIRARANFDRFDPAPLLTPLASADPSAARDPEAVADFLLRGVLGRSSESARSALADFAASNGGRVTPELITGMLLLITAMPEYQLC